MSTTVKAKSDFQQVPAGTHPAYCYAVIDLGFQSGPYGTKPQLILAFEYPMEIIEIDGESKPMIMNTFYSATISSKSNLRRDLESWRGKAFTPEELDGFELKAVVGKPCSVNVFHNEDGKARVSGVGAAIKGLDMPAMFNAPLWFDLEEHGVLGDAYARIPEWIQEIISKRVDPDTENPAPEITDEKGTDEFDDDIPF